MSHFVVAPILTGRFGLPVGLAGRISRSGPRFLLGIERFQCRDVEFRIAIVTSDGLVFRLELQRCAAVRALIADRGIRHGTHLTFPASSYRSSCRNSPY